jgi:hypothetical protein
MNRSCNCCSGDAAKCSCSCHSAGKKPKPPCCGDPEPAGLEPEGPRPGWSPTRPLRVSPWRVGEDPEDRRKRFSGVLLDEVRRGAGPLGPTFGKRKNEWLPYLVIRASAGDRGNRPMAGPFWESPDIFVAPNVAAEDAPPLPATRRETALAGAPNTLWAHVWNLGRAPVVNARVEFYWCDPSLGISANSAHLIGVGHADLGDRDSGRGHTVVKCPVTWVPQFVNGGHECLVVRFFEPLTDALPRPGWDAARQRHVAQRNIQVLQAASPAAALIPLRLGCNAGPGPARVVVERVLAKDVAWLSLLSGSEERRPIDSTSVKETVGLLPPSIVTDPQSRISVDLDAVKDVARLLRSSINVQRGCDELETQFVVRVEGLEPGECTVYRVRQHSLERTLGGYTVIAYRSV